MVLPVLILFAAALAWLVAAGVSEVRDVDAAREVARALARGDPQPEALDLGHRVAPPGSAFVVAQGDGTVTVTVTGVVSGPGGILDFLPGQHVHATAVAATEPDQ
ncbi:MAG: hypothetical protein JWP74_1629 [Marmoricola sp.]|nr:hypothetical protein [Marmoricola sp.]